MNLKACAQCGVRDMPTASAAETLEDDDGEETTTYNRRIHRGSLQFLDVNTGA